MMRAELLPSEPQRSQKCGFGRQWLESSSGIVKRRNAMDGDFRRRQTRAAFRRSAYLCLEQVQCNYGVLGCIVIVAELSVCGADA